MMEDLNVQSITMDSFWKNSLNDPLGQNSYTRAKLGSSTTIPANRHKLAWLMPLIWASWKSFGWEEDLGQRELVSTY